MKHFKQLLLVVMVALTSCVTANAYNFEVDGIYYNILSEEDLTCEITYKEFDSYTNKSPYSGDFVVPSKISFNGQAYSVAEIGSLAFYGCSGLTSIYIPNSVTAIGSGAFGYCSGLTSINIPNSVTEIGSGAFSGCYGLPVEDNLRYADTYLVGAVDKTLSTYTIKDGTKCIGSYAFWNCSKMTSITIPNSVTEIDESAFSGCSGLTSVFITDIAAWCKIKFDDNYYNANPLSYAHNLYLNDALVTHLEIPNSVTEIGSYAFFGFSGLTSITIPNSVTTIEDYTFRNCSNLTSVSIGNSVTEIRSWLFGGCSALTELKLGSGVEVIGSNAFSSCPLTDVYVSWNNPAGLNIEDGAFKDVFKITLHVPVGCTRKYETRSPWNNFKEIVEYVPGGNEGEEKCAAPVITVEDNKLVFASATPGSKFYYTIDCNDQTALTNSDNGTVDLNATYNITVYAYANGHDNSETVTATLVWVNPTLQDQDNIISMEAKKAVLIRANGNSIVVSGTERGERIELYSLGGSLLGTTVANDGETIIPCNMQKGEVVIVKYGDKTVKCRL